MTITLRGASLINPAHAGYQPGRRVLITLVIDPSAGNLSSVDAGKGAAVTVACPVVSLTYTYADTGASIGNTPPGTVSVTFGPVQPQYASSGERAITASLPDYSAGAGLFVAAPVRVVAFETYGTVWVADIVTTAPADTGVPGTGLLGRWFGNRDLTGSPTAQTTGVPYLTSTTGTVYPGGLPPAPLASGDTYSVRFTGRIKIPVTGKYRFRLDADDGCRLYLNGRTVLDFWSDQNRRQRLTGYEDYTAGDLVTVWIEMYNKGGGSDRGWLEFAWEVPGAQFVNVPVTALYSTDGTEALPPALAPPPQRRYYATTFNRY